MFALFKYFYKSGRLSDKELKDGKEKLSKGYQNVMKYKTKENGFSVSSRSNDVSVIF